MKTVTTYELDSNDVRKAICYWLHNEHGITVETSGLRFDIVDSYTGSGYSNDLSEPAYIRKVTF